MKATNLPTTTSGRRALLGATAAAMVAGAAAALPAAAEAAPDANEAELIRLCNRLVAIKAEELKLYTEMPPVTPEAEKRLKEHLKPGSDAWWNIEARIYELDVTPKTPAGISAVARAALVEAPRHSDGSVIADDLSNWLVWTVIEAIEPNASMAEKAQTLATNKACHRALDRVAS